MEIKADRYRVFEMFTSYDHTKLVLYVPDYLRRIDLIVNTSELPCLYQLGGMKERESGVILPTKDIQKVHLIPDNERLETMSFNPLCLTLREEIVLIPFNTKKEK